MNWTEIPAGRLDAAVNAMLRAFGDDMGKIEHATVWDPGFTRRLAAFVREDLKLTANFHLAREIMGKNFFGPREATQYFKVNYGAAEMCDLEKIPFTPDTLEACKDTHILVAVFPFSIIDIGNIKHMGRSDLNMFGASDWYRYETWGQEKGKVGWQLIRKTPVPESYGKQWILQANALFVNEEIPTAQALVYAVVGYFLMTGEWLFSCEKVRTREMTVVVSADPPLHWSQLMLETPSNSDEQLRVGLASAIKPLV